jgi:hypothetical protein
VHMHSNPVTMLVYSNQSILVFGLDPSPAHAAGLSPAPVESRPILFWGWFRPIFILGRVWPIQKVFFKDVFKKSVIFCKFVFLYCKYTNPVLKYPVFVNKKKCLLKKMFCFHAYGHYPNIVFTFFFLSKKQIFEV